MNSYITTKTDFLNNLQEFSISLWYEPLDTTREGGDFETLICRDLGKSCPNRNGQWSVGLFDCRKAVFGRTTSVWDFDITNTNNGTSNLEYQEELIARTNNWHHLVATFKQDGVEMSIYRDGVLKESSTGISYCDSKDIGDLFLGKDYTGKIDDVIIFNKSLNQQEINSLFKMDTCCEE